MNEASEGGNDMEWKDARQKIEREITVGLDLNTEQSTLRQVLATDYVCDKYNYDGEKGFRIRISNVDYQNLEIPWSMLETCYKALQSPEGYNGKFFRQVYPLQARVHSCHVHVVGMIFEKAGLARKEGRNYYIREK